MKKISGKRGRGVPVRKPFTSTNPDEIIESKARGRLGFTPERVNYEVESARLKEESQKLASPKPIENVQREYIETFEDFSSRILQTTTNMFDPAVKAAMIALSQGREPIVPSSIQQHTIAKNLKKGSTNQISIQQGLSDYNSENNKAKSRSTSSGRSPGETPTENYELNTGKDTNDTITKKEQSFVTTFGADPKPSKDNRIWKSEIKSQLMLNSDIKMVRRKSTKKLKRGLITQSSMLRRDDLLDNPPVSSYISSSKVSRPPKPKETKKDKKVGYKYFAPSKSFEGKSKGTFPIYEKYKALREFALTNGFPFDDEAAMQRALQLGKYSPNYKPPKLNIEDDEAKERLKLEQKRDATNEEKNSDNDIFVSKFVNIPGTKKKTRFGKSFAESIKMPNLTGEQEFWKNMRPPSSAIRVKSVRSVKMNPSDGPSRGYGSGVGEVENIYKAPPKPRVKLSVISGVSNVDPLESIMDLQGSQQTNPTTPFLKEMKTRRLRQLKTKVHAGNIRHSIYSHFNIEP